MNKFTLVFKTPDVMDQCDLTDEQLQFAEKFIRYGEMIIIEFSPDDCTTEAMEQ